MKTADIPKKYQAIYRRAMQGRSRKDAIRASCLVCANWVAPEVRLCPAENCPLWHYRLGELSHEEASRPAS